MAGPKLWDELGFANLPVRERESTREATLRIGDVERNRMTDALHEHYAQGRLTKDELDERLDATLAAKTFADLRPVTADLPELAGPEPAQPAGRARGLNGLRGAFAGPLAFVAVPLGLLLTVVALMVVLRAAFFLLPILMIAWLVMAMMGHGRRRAWRDGGQFPGFHGYGRGYGHGHRRGRGYGMEFGNHYGHRFGNR